MFVLTRLWAALASLAESLDNLAATVRTADTQLRNRLALEHATAESPTPAIEASPTVDAT